MCLVSRKACVSELRTGKSRHERVNVKFLALVVCICELPGPAVGHHRLSTGKKTAGSGEKHVPGVDYQDCVVL